MMMTSWPPTRTKSLVPRDMRVNYDSNSLVDVLHFPMVSHLIIRHFMTQISSNKKLRAYQSARLLAEIFRHIYCPLPGEFHKPKKGQTI